MRINHSVRFALCAAVVGSASLAMVLPGSIASAKGPKPPKPDKVVCTKLSGNETTQTITGCTGGPAGMTSGVSTAGTTTGSGGTASVTWNDGKTSNETFTFTLKTGKSDHCKPPAGLTNVAEAKEKGSVTGGTETALTGGKVQTTACVFSDESLSNYPGKPIKF
jgi:hypothetical protein